MSLACRTLLVLATLALPACVTSAALAAQPGDDHPSFTPLRQHLAGAGGEESITDLVVQRDGKLVASVLDDAEVDRRIVRLLPDGRLDPSFGVGGSWHLPRDAATYVRTLALAPDGSIVFGGEDADRPGIVVGRLTSDGQLDTSFSADGLAVVPTAAGSAPLVEEVLVQDDGRILFAGVIDAPPMGDELFIGRLRADGSDDPDFAGEPYRTFGSPYEQEGDAFGGMALLASGDVLVGDVRQLDGPIIWKIGPDSQYFIAANVDLPSDLDVPLDIIATSATHAVLLAAGGGSTALAYLDVSGTPTIVPGGGADGVARPFPASFTGHELLRHGDGRYVVAGVDSSGGATHRAIARVLANGTLDPTFASGGIRHLPGRSTPSFYLSTQAIAEAGDGSIVSGYHVLDEAGVRMSAVDRVVSRIARVGVAVLAPAGSSPIETTTTFTVRVTNAGPDASGAGSVAFSLSDQLRVMSVTGPDCSATSRGGTCRFVNLGAGGSFDVAVRVRASAAGSWGVSAVTGATTFDDDVADDASAATSSFVAPPAAPKPAAAPPSSSPASSPRLRLTIHRIDRPRGRVLRGCGSRRAACHAARVRLRHHHRHARARARVRHLYVRLGARPVPVSGRRRVVLLMQQRVGRRWVTRLRPQVVIGRSGRRDLRLPLQWRTHRGMWRVRAQSVVPRGRLPVRSWWIHFRVR